MQEFFSNKVIPAIMKFVSLKGVVALKDGLLYTMPLTIVGSVFLLLANFPVPAVVNWFDSMGWIDPLNQAYGATFNIIALIGVIGIAYKYVKNEGYEALNAGVLAAVTFILTTDSFVVTESGEIVSNVINKTWTAGQGMISAIIIGLLVGWIYSWFMKNDIRIKMPAGVPEGVANSFTALIPGFVIVTGATLIYSFFKFVLDTTFIEAVYAFIQTPLQGLTDSLGGVIVMSLMIPFLWFFGIHGSTIVGGIIGSVLTANSLANQAILDSGMALTIENGGRIVTQQFLDQFINVTGAGMTIGLVIYMIFFAKSAQCKELGRLGGVPGLFNINEPILFGTPIVMNPFLAIPFIAMPVISGLILYFSIAVGLVPMFGGVMVPWTTPPIVSGFLVGGWKMAVLQTFILALSFFVYLPFIRKIDKMNLQAEKGTN
ncbi:PTS sugar transporter subunit IIC [Turicibacter bilis]|uniref:PTS sugar transporter subunit IIC n=1 Tax=Turicibacter bilis TaxID=2735723 RepID=UPI0006C34F84|nr:PTS sugar transporter subunit IIC [Turicibacter bilis]MDD5984492.1 PTS sugar transporter subunit IIC [Turicibacter sp.]CUN82938.1 PTS system oligo-beta-mannoside-specific EIIC component [Turicibacter sanguinis]MBS3202156.1 PTS sugar transporter subunit IIC [Turicibacter bilis]MDD6760064.1 PTS sugar transporter subunit IIC [Turicibacter sp.]MDY4815558.1 PTS sugar transporter subunit IIC [Turicibacter bilis]